jgi:hypothetical protein
MRGADGFDLFESIDNQLIFKHPHTVMNCFDVHFFVLYERLFLFVEVLHDSRVNP